MMVVLVLVAGFPMFKGEMGREWMGVVNGIIASRLSGGGKKLLNRPNPGEKIELRARSSGSCIEGELVLTELARLFRSEFVLSFSKGCHLGQRPSNDVRFVRLFRVSLLV